MIKKSPEKITILLNIKGQNNSKDANDNERNDVSIYLEYYRSQILRKMF